MLRYDVGGWNMKNFLAVLGGLALVAFIIIAGGLIWLGFQLNGVTKEAKLYTQETVTAVASEWDGDALFERADDVLLNNLNKSDVERVTEEGNRAIGRLQSMDPVECTATISTHTSTGKKATANCTVRAVHERGEGFYTLIVIRRDNAWALNTFHFDTKSSKEAPKEV
ncbi:MAG: hypothetical protein DHS20C05_16860 [Hyphococcus sp.]|nr:MAG: hypothetical protein DHS20C05_16860 [Marinicaulis sp.]